MCKVFLSLEGVNAASKAVSPHVVSPCIFAATPLCPLSPPPILAASLLHPRHSPAVTNTHRGHVDTQTYKDGLGGLYDRK